MSSSGYGGNDGVYRSAQHAAFPSHPHQSFPAFLFRGEISEPKNANKPLLIDSATGSIITCSDFRRLVSLVANNISSILRLSQGDVVLLLVSNTIYFPVIFNAILSLGGVVTTANPSNTSSEIRRQLRDSSCKFIFTMSEYVEKLGDYPGTLVLLDSPPLNSQSPKLVLFEQLLESKATSCAPDVRLRLGDSAVILYSSGTTGPSKGVVLSHGNLIAAVSSVLLSRDGGRVEEEEDTVAFILLPLFHVAGLIWLGCLSLRTAATLIVVRRFDFVHMLQLIEKYRVTSLPLVPPIVVGLMKHPAVEKYDLSSLRRASSGAAPLGKDTIETFLAKFPQIKQFTQGYGMTETTGIATGGAAPLGSAGKLLPALEAKVVDVDSGNPLPPNQKGELWLRGPCIMQGYLNNPKATAETIDTDGWLRTGDLVYIDDEGYVYVVDRLKELIKYKGFQVAPAELEALLLTHPAIVDVAVVPFPNDDAGEVPLAYVVCDQGKSVTADDVIDFVARQVAPHKKVRKVGFLEAIPKSQSGKILRKDLVAMARAKSRL